MFQKNSRARLRVNNQTQSRLYVCMYIGTRTQWSLELGKTLQVNEFNNQTKRICFCFSFRFPLVVKEVNDTIYDLFFSLFTWKNSFTCTFKTKKEKRTKTLKYNFLSNRNCLEIVCDDVDCNDGRKRRRGSQATGKNEAKYSRIYLF